MLVGQEFNIMVDVQKGRYKVQVKCTYASSQVYRLLVSGGKREMVLRTDFPFVYSQKKRTKPACWKIEQGEMPGSGSAFFAMIEAIELYLQKDLRKVI